jgi:DNA repair photolyase
MQIRRTLRGRGAGSNPTGRYEKTEREAADDGWGALAETHERPAVTEVGVDTSRSVITRNDSPDVPFNRSINPYRGCEHGCVYCFARPSHAYLGLSPGLDFETKIFTKPDAAALLSKELSAPRYRPEPLALGANTDPYQPIERRERVTRAIVEVLHRCQHPVCIVTKSDLVLRDLDLLAPMAAQRLCSVMVSITTLDPELARRMEPRASVPARRLAALAGLSQAGVPVGVLASPMIPGLNDHELERILEAAHAAGARRAGTILLRLPHELKRLFPEWLEAHYPERSRKVLTLLRDTRGGALYENAFGTRMTGRGPYAELLRQRFDHASRRLGFNDEPVELDSSRFVPPRPNDGSGGEGRGRQLTLFG